MSPRIIEISFSLVRLVDFGRFLHLWCKSCHSLLCLLFLPSCDEDSPEQVDFKCCRNVWGMLSFPNCGKLATMIQYVSPCRWCRAEVVLINYNRRDNWWTFRLSAALRRHISGVCVLMLYGLSMLQLFQHPANVLGFEYAVSLEQVEDCVIPVICMTPHSHHSLVWMVCMLHT